MNEKHKKWINISLYLISYITLAYLFFHMDALIEAMYSLKIDESVAPLARSITIECNDTICSIETINDWVYKNVKINDSYPHSIKGAIEDLMKNSVDNIIKNGGVCRHKTILALSMIKSLDIKGCKPESMIVISNGLSGHMWFECDINNTHIECDPAFGNCSVVKYG